MDFETNKRAINVIAQGALTNSKRPASFIEGVYPTHLISARDCEVTDTAGNKYVDFICGMGSNLLGYGHSLVGQAVTQAFNSGATLSLSSTKEVELGEKIREIIPFVERIKILKSGSEGCTAAVRIARAFTGRERILTQGYSGWHDEFISLQPPAFGVVGKFPISKLIDISQIDDGIAAVLLEPIITDYSEEHINWLRQLRAQCTKVGAVLIFDETITGLRFPNFCVANWCGVFPDMIIFGKALAGGLPISVVGGSDKIMNCTEYFISSTFAGDRVAISAAIAVITALQRNYDLTALWRSGIVFQKSFNEIIEDVRLDGYPTRGVLSGEPMVKAIFMQEAVRAGLLFGASWFYIFPHMEKLDGILSTLKEIAMKIKVSKPRLEGLMPKSPFAQQMRESK